MVHHNRTRTQSWWSVKNPHESNNTYDNEAKKPGMRRTYSEETNLSESKFSSNYSSGDESWSDSSPTSGKTKLSGEAGLFVPQQPKQGSGERTKLSSGASVFVPGQMASQMTPNFAPHLPQASPMFMPQMVPMDQGMPCVAPCYYMAPDGCYYMAPDGCMMCPVAMHPAPSGAAPPLAPLPLEAPMVPAEEPVEELKKPATPVATIKDSKPKGKAWADLMDDDDEEDPWLQ